jgi:hypothetical protein
MAPSTETEVERRQDTCGDLDAFRLHGRRALEDVPMPVRTEHAAE